MSREKPTRTDEASELIKQATKLMIFGKRAHHEGVDYDNVKLLGLEYGDLHAIQCRALAMKLIDRDDVRAGIERKVEKLPVFSRHFG